ncbi:hypothetical protein EAH68_07400 [Corynebacterium hylobatis]|uniref:Uncharacterized protein n=1 Tax=Corynebacterium hylobatis TaxID=1859290 RepID=A0A3R9ZDM4_9CORY|nr:hypothetical protein [Corynebacterium hylobatis]RSZ63483.1 hypothetical protein EAH68_07400 [Corynebacterium hylobatis]
MTIRAEFQPTVDEFLSNLHSFATGDYLKPDEKEFWEQPFDPAVLPELRGILEKFLDALDVLPADPTADTLVKVVQVTVDSLLAFNGRNHDAVLEPEETAELNELIHDASAATGADDEALAELPEID